MTPPLHLEAGVENGSDADWARPVVLSPLSISVGFPRCEGTYSWCQKSDAHGKGCGEYVYITYV